MEDTDFQRSLEEMRQEAVRNSVWATRPVTAEPSITLIQWRIVELPDKSRHCVGYNRAWPEGRVSSKIIVLDASSKRAITESGRVYQLEGGPGLHSDAEYVLALWLHAQGLALKDAVDVTTEAFGSPAPSPARGLGGDSAV